MPNEDLSDYSGLARRSPFAALAMLVFLFSLAGIPPTAGFAAKLSIFYAAIQGGYYWLDSAPKTISAQPHRPAYGSDGDYWSKPSVEDLFDAVYEIMHEANPRAYPALYK